MLVLGLDFYVAHGHQQMTGQIGNRFFFRARCNTLGLIMNGLQPQAASSVFPDHPHQGEIIHLRTLSETGLIDIYTVRFSGIDLVAVNHQSGGGIGCLPTDTTVGCDFVDTAGGGCQQSVTTLAQFPADIVDVSYTPVTPRVNHIESVGVPDVDLSVKGCDGMNPARQSVLRQEIAVYRRQFDGKDTVTRSAPEHTVTVVGHVRHLIGAEAVILGDGINVATVAVCNNQATVPLYFHLEPAVQFLRLGDVFHNDILGTCLQSLQRYDVGFHTWL